MSTNVKLPDSADIHWHDGGGRPAGEEMICKHDVTQDCPACAEETISHLESALRDAKLLCEEYAARITAMGTALEEITAAFEGMRPFPLVLDAMAKHLIENARAALKATA